MEHAILHSMANVVSNRDLSISWEKASMQISITLKEMFFEQMAMYQQAKKATGVESYPIFCLQMKQTVMRFCCAMEQRLSLHAAPLTEQLEEYKNTFYDTLMQEVERKVRAIIDKETYIPMSTNSSQHVQTLRLYRLLPSKPNEVDEKNVPFTSTVPELVELLAYQFVDPLFSYSLYLGSMEDSIREGLVKLLSFTNECFDKSLMQFVTQQVPIYIQVSINTEYFGKALLFLEDFYQQKLVVYTSSSHKPKTELAFLKPSYSILMLTRGRAEDLLINYLTSKTNDFFQLSSPHFSLGVISLQAEAHAYVVDMMRFLNESFILMKYLSKEKREYFAFCLCQHLSNKLMQTLCAGSSELNMYIIRQYRRDYELVEQFGNTCGTLKCQFCFQPSCELLDFLIKEDTETYNGMLKESCQNDAKLLNVLGKYQNEVQHDSDKFEQILRRMKVVQRDVQRKKSGLVLPSFLSSTSTPNTPVSTPPSSPAPSTQTTPSTPSQDAKETTPAKKKRFFGLF